MKPESDWPGSAEVSQLAHDDLACLRESSQHGYDVAGGLDALKARLAAESATSAAPPKAATSAKLVAGIVAGGVGALVVTGVLLLGGEARESSSAPSHAAPTVVVVPEAPSLAQAAPVTTETASVRVDELPNAPPPRAPSVSTAPAAPTDTVDAELAHAARLRTLAQTDPERALREADEGNRRYGRGVLSEERDAIAIDALVRLGRTDEMRSRAGAFLRAHPRGPRAERVRALLAGALAD